MAKLKRSALLHYLQNPNQGDADQYFLLGRDIEDGSVSLNPDMDKTKNILDEVSINDKGYEPEYDVDTYYANPSDGWIYEWLKEIALNRLTGDDCMTKIVEVLADKTTGPYDAWREDVIVKPQSYGGPQGGVTIPFNIGFCGNREQGNASLSGKTLGTFSTGSIPSSDD
ncbi:MAG: hypothetical protein Q4D35_03045 [Ruminococcus sp.]|nr:hypothetical protein [Ruminococcus sp.]